MGSFTSCIASVANGPVNNFEEIFRRAADVFEDPIVPFLPKEVNDSMSHNQTKRSHRLVLVTSVEPKK